MRLLGIDFETTGLDLKNDRIIEVGYCLWDTEDSKPLVTECSLVYASDYPSLKEEASAANGIFIPELVEFAQSPNIVFSRLQGHIKAWHPEYIVAHNGLNFDKPMWEAECERLGLDFPAIPWLDTKEDLPFQREPDSRRLRHLALDHGFINPFEHRALFDVMAMLKVLSHYDIHEVIRYSEIPTLTVRAMVRYETRELAKEKAFRWNPEEKIWFKRVKETEFEALKNACKFSLEVLENYP